MKEGLVAVSEGMSVKHTLAHCGAISADTHRRFARDEVYQWGVEQYWYDGTVCGSRSTFRNFPKDIFRRFLRAPTNRMSFKSSFLFTSITRLGLLLYHRRLF